MPLLRSFRLSIYLTLALACLSLGYAEEGLLPETPYITVSVIVLIAVAYQFEGRWSLSLGSANMVGAILAVALIAWIGFQFVRPPTGLLEYLPFPASLLPYLGPVLMILVPAKLFRPKHIGDFWAMQGIGLLAVTLACAMAYDLIFCFLLIAYLFSFAWSLALFYLYREVRPSDPTPGEIVTEPAPNFRLGKLSTRWSLLIVGGSLLLFLVTPRPAERPWELSMVVRGKLITGLSEGLIDLNRDGSLEPNREVAFEVYADDVAGNPILNLNPNQHWRASSLSFYENGRWLRDRPSGIFVQDRITPNQRRDSRPFAPEDRLAMRNERLPDFGPDAIYLRYRLHRNAGNWNILADPVLWRSQDLPPVYVHDGGRGTITHREDGQFEWYSTPGGTRGGYTQITLPLTDPDLSPPMNISLSYQELLTQFASAGLAERLRRWTTNLLVRLVREQKLPQTVLEENDPLTQLPLARHHEAIARAFESYLAASGEYGYSLTMNRRDKGADPIEDFLFNTKTGYCQQFASALVLMLRSQGIPAQLVLGFRGGESRGGGWYDIRQSDAHAWVETIVTRSPPRSIVPSRRGDKPPSTEGESFHWLTLDPTPSTDADIKGEGGFVNWLWGRKAWSESVFRNFVLGYDSTARQQAVKSIVASVQETVEAVREGDIPWWMTASIVGTGLALGWIFLIPHSSRRPRAITQRSPLAAPWKPFHDRLLKLLARRGFDMKLGATPREFTEEVAVNLRSDPRTVGVAEIPLSIAEACYRVCFGDQHIPPEEQLRLDAAIEQLEQVLSTARST